MKNKIITFSFAVFSFLFFVFSIFCLITPSVKGRELTDQKSLYSMSSDNHLIFYTKRLSLPRISKSKRNRIAELLTDINYEVDWVNVNNRDKTYNGSTICYDSNKDFVIVSARKNDGSKKRDLAFQSPYSSIGIDLQDRYFVDSPLSPVCSQIYSIDLFHDLFVFKDNTLYYLKDAYDLEIINKHDFNNFERNYINFYNFRLESENGLKVNEW